MGKSIIIADDRQNRAQGLMKDEWEELLGQENLTLSDRIPEYSTLKKFDVICFHGSLLKRMEQEDLLSSLLKDEKHIIFYSGDISQVNLTEHGHLLKIPAVSFYSKYLIPFCQYLNTMTVGEIHLLSIVYGVDHWRIPNLLQLRQLLWQYPEGKRKNAQNTRISELMGLLSISDAGQIDVIITNELRSL